MVAALARAARRLPRPGPGRGVTSVLHAEGVWLAPDGSILGYGCSDGDECSTCFALVEVTAGVAEFASYDQLAAYLGEPTATDDDARERAR